MACAPSLHLFRFPSAASFPSRKNPLFSAIPLFSSPACPPLAPLRSARPAAAGLLGVVSSGSGYNVQIVVGEDEPEEALLRRFRREVSKAGVIQECKRRRFFENKQEERKRKAREAGRRNRRRRSGPRFATSSAPSQSDDAASKKTADDIDDNWEMPDGDLPY